MLDLGKRTEFLEELRLDPIKTIGPATPRGAAGPFNSSLFLIKLDFVVPELFPTKIIGPFISPPTSAFAGANINKENIKVRALIKLILDVVLELGIKFKFIFNHR